jgi:hypothetical protein
MRTRGTWIIPALLALPPLVVALALGVASLLPAAQILAPERALSPEEDALIDQQIGQQCSKCHVRPPAKYVARGQWRFRVQEMAERSMTGTGVPPGEESLLWQLDLDKIIQWLESRAPEVLPMPDAWPPGDGGLVFVKHAFDPPGNPPKPVVSNVRFYDLDGDGEKEIVACDMGRGSLFIAQPLRSPGVLTQIAVLSNPAHAEMVDLDQDGMQDLLVSDLGEFLPADHEKGSVVWMRQTAPLQFEKRLLIEHLPRTADARAADFDGDGDLDLVVAAYGWRKVGSTIYFENQTTDWNEPSFVPYTIDARPGPSTSRSSTSTATDAWTSSSSCPSSTSTWWPTSPGGGAPGSARRRSSGPSRRCGAPRGSRWSTSMTTETPTC